MNLKMLCIILFSLVTLNFKGVYAMNEKRNVVVFKSSIAGNNKHDAATFLTIDYKSGEYIFEQSIEYLDMIGSLLISQGVFKVFNNSIKLIDKNNNFVFQGFISKNTITFTQGMKFLINIELKNLYQDIYAPEDGSSTEFWNLEDIYFDYPKYSCDKTIISIKGKYGEYPDNEKKYSSTNIEFNGMNYILYYRGIFNYEISSGKWDIQSGVLTLKDNDGINTMKFDIIDENTIIPQRRLPFADNIGFKPLKFLGYKNEYRPLRGGSPSK